MAEDEEPPILTAVSNSARQLYLLLRCINFSEKAHVVITEEGIKFSVEEASSMEGSAFLDKSLFTTYIYRAPPRQEQPEQDNSDTESDTDLNTTPSFQISLPSLLETLQILGLTDPNNSKPLWARDNPSSTAFTNNVLGLNNMCLISYRRLGCPLSIILTESTIRTTCDLTTYEPDYADEIPFDRQSLAFKTIMRGTWLFDAISELSSTAPEHITLIARMSKGKPKFALSATGSLGSVRVELHNNGDSITTGAAHPSRPGAVRDADDVPKQANLLETFQLGDPTTPLRAAYKFSLIQKAAKAMSIATKVSVRVDTQGVLSLQFMIEVGGGEAGGGGGKVSFVDFRFVPLVDDEGDGDYEDEEEGKEGGDDGGEEEEEL
ncbi:DNA repair exonuclease rad1 [Westerdykella ornata]|uniref:DNA repair exonuclease rad1 n=1 Tax=Westerdykella ornata TaxID=318751 RepID=A0A6A6JAY5_WESOR|nr:DNA repair exonuclease rad1 [Westerdykella ornata]KAF2273445.1 DNA repair exonuclease rad1 [Westerdykella ornata]